MEIRKEEVYLNDALEDFGRQVDMQTEMANGLMKMLEVGLKGSKPEHRMAILFSLIERTETVSNDNLNLGINILIGELVEQKSKANLKTTLEAIMFAVNKGWNE